MPRTNTQHAPEFIRNLLPFTTNGALSGYWAGATYVVNSYTTAIAAVTPDGVAALLTARYSRTTTQHQTIAAGALSGLAIVNIDSPAEFTKATGQHARQTTKGTN